MSSRVTGPTFDAARATTPARVWSKHLGAAPGSDLDLDGVRRVVVVGAHPDDESLGAGGLIATARDLGLPVDLVCVSDGSRSHPASPTHSPETLARRRHAEWQAAAARLGVDEDHLHWLGLPDGEVVGHLDALVSAVVRVVGEGEGVILAATWREDGHPDHEAVGRGAAAAARRTDACLWEFPLWFWQWAGATDPRTEQLRPLALDPRRRSAKSAAVAEHGSQIGPLSDRPGDDVLLTPDFLEHFAGDREWFVVTPGHRCPDDTLDRLHRRLADPWGVDSRWYEQRKRELLLAMLPQRRYRHVLEVGCSTGALTQALAARADRVLGVDSSATALESAARRLADLPQVDLERRDVPSTWPDGEFDLVVISEVGYFLSPAALERLVGRVAQSLSGDAAVMLCHWRHPVEGWVLDAEAVHRAFDDDPMPPLRATYRDRDVEILLRAREWLEHDR